jgi:hypothetical protein
MQNTSKKNFCQAFSAISLEFGFPVFVCVTNLLEFIHIDNRGQVNGTLVMAGDFLIEAQIL